jgi:hypothetical protein
MSKRSHLYGIGLLALLAVVMLVLATPQPVAAEPAEIQHTTVNWHPQSGSGEVPGASARLVRNDEGVTFTFNARELNAGHVYTIWFIVVNDPDACASTPCTGADIILNSDGVDADVVYGAGHVVGESGRASFSGHISTGDLPGSWFGNGFSNPRGGEIHLTLNDHGPLIPGLADNMIHSYRGGCTDESLPGIFPDTAFADGIPGPNTCRLYQTAVFQP